MACTSCKGFNIVIENGFDNPSLLLTEGVNSTALENQLKPMFSAALAEMTTVSYSHFTKVKNINLDKALAKKLEPIVEKYIKKIVEKDYLANLITKSVDKSNVTLKNIELKKENLQQIKQELIKAKIEIDKKSNEVASVLKYATFLFSVLAPQSAANLAQLGIAKNLVRPSKPTSRMTKTPSGAKIIKKAGVDLIRDPVTGEMRPPRPEDFAFPVEDGEDLRQRQEEIKISLYNKNLLNERPRESWDWYLTTKHMTPAQRKAFQEVEREGVKYFNDFMGVIDPTGIFDGINVVLYAQDYAMTTDQKKKDEALLNGLFSLIGALVPYAGDLVVKPFKFGYKIGKKTPTQAIKDLIEFVQKYAPKLLKGLKKLISKAPKKVKEFYNRLLSLIKDPNKIQKIVKVGTKGAGYANRAAAEATELFVRRWSELTAKQVGTQVAVYGTLYGALHIEKVRELFGKLIELPVEVLAKMVSLANDAKSLDEIIEQINQTKLLDNHQIVKNILIKLYELAEEKSRDQKTKADLGKSADEPLQENNKAIKIRILENKTEVLNENKAIKSLVDDFLVAIKKAAPKKAGPRALKIKELLEGEIWKKITQYTKAADYSTFIRRLKSAGITTKGQASNELNHLITQLKRARNAIGDVRQIEIDINLKNQEVLRLTRELDQEIVKARAAGVKLDQTANVRFDAEFATAEASQEALAASEKLKAAQAAKERAQKELTALNSLESNKKAIEDQIASLEARKKQLLSGGKATDAAAKTATKTTDDAAKEVAKNAKKGSFWKRAVKGAGKRVLIGYGIYAGTNIVCRALAESVVSFKLLQSLLRSDFLKWMEGLAVAVTIGAYDTIKTVFGVSAATAAKTYGEKFGLVGSIVLYTASGFFGCAEGGTERLSISFAAGLTKANVPQTMNEITRRMAVDTGIPESKLNGALYTLTERPDVLSWQFLGRAGLSVIPFVEQDYGSIANSLIRKTDIADYALRVTTGTIGILASPDDVLDLDDETKEKALNFIQNAFEQKTFLPSEAIRQIIITKKYLEKNGLRDKTLQSQFIKCMYKEYALQIAKSTKRDIKAAFDTLGISKEGIKDPNKVINKIIGTGLETFEEIEKKYNEADEQIQKGLEAYGFKNPIRKYLEAAKNYVREGKDASPTEAKNFKLTYEDTKKYLEGELKYYKEKYKANTPEKQAYKTNNIKYYEAMIKKLEELHNKIKNQEIKKEEDVEENKPTYSCIDIKTKYKALWEKTTRVFNISKGIDFKPGDEVQRISDGEYYDVVSVNTEKRTMNLRDEETELEDQKFSNYLISDKKPKEGK